MADANYEAEQLARILEQLNQELRDHGMVSQETNRKLYDAQMKAKYGIDNATEAFNKGGQAVGLLGKAATQTASALYNNQKGAKAFGGALDSVTDAAMAASAGLMLLGGPLGIVAGGLALAGAAALKYAKIAGEQSDALYKGFQDISKSGGAASDGLSGLFSDIQKLGLGFQDLDEYAKLIASSNRELAMFGGSVSKGRRDFANVGASLNQYRDRLMNMGLSQTEINEGLMNYLRLQTRVGQTQNRTTEQLAESARKYLVEQDALTKLTGMTRKEQEDAREEVLSQERFAAKAAELRARGEGAKADEMVATYAMLRKYNKDAAQGFADLSTGMITTEAAQKSYFATQGDGMRVAQQVAAGQMTAVQATQRLAKVYGQTAESLRPLALIGGFEDVAGSYAGAVELGILSQNDLNAQYKKIKEDQAKQGVKDGKAADAALQAQTDLRISQQESTLGLQKFVNYGVEPATEALGFFTETLNKVVGITESDAQKANKAAKERAAKEGKGWWEQQWEGAKAGVKATLGMKEPPGMAKPGKEAQKLGTGGASANQLADFGLKIKEGGDVQKSGEQISPGLLELAKQIQSAIPGFKYFSGFNDEYHKGTKSKHAQGMALDFTVDGQPDVKQGKQIIDIIKGLGASKVIDEYNFPTSRTTAGHFHVEVPKFKDGGIAEGPTDGYPVELHGKEAVVPLPDGKSIPVELQGKEEVVPLPNNKPIPVEMLGNNELIGTISELTAKLKLIQGNDLLDINKSVSVEAQAEIDKMSARVSLLQKEAERRSIDVANATKIVPSRSNEDLMAEMFGDMKKFANGGITQGPSIAGEAGPEAVVPLPNGNSIPVTMQGTDQLIHTIADLTAKLNLIQGNDLVDTARSISPEAQAEIDKMTQLVSAATAEAQGRGINVAKATEIMPQQSVNDLTAELLKDIQTEQTAEMQNVMQQTTDGFKSALREVVEQMGQNANNGSNEQLVGLLQELIKSNKDSVSVQQKILQTSY